ncbi:hypothetical protein TREMEDRAFT_65988 [Tremella mesenterica DSM 1558]|uniref:uncharacterized protein n=1 Tax=Tremella mesenterica (strain ATCC 24925 / CBS 8224 / DSM 1558 / NBRC 9311 / NRRL Y-6157 / RJB 2259-6 / UBC 559-6) TaxID=578456 RepID=UPI00032BA8D2|nr:uncharacterized protein TREMEDRAFT_65988 [Tremella mesenterica DSM 1558]EIW65903.1 hypothetical protein TREMEDRAFT_65988 [Tremella mesenterica DSM 1558]
MSPLWYAIYKSNTLSPGSYNNAMPKDSWTTLKDKVPSKIVRAVAANENSHIWLSSGSQRKRMDVCGVFRKLALLGVLEGFLGWIFESSLLRYSNLPFFASALVIGNIVHLDRTTLHLGAATYLVSRVAYTLSYILGENRRSSLLRSGFYWTGVISCLTLFVKSANRLSRIPWDTSL